MREISVLKGDVMKTLFCLLVLALPCAAQGVPKFKDYPAEAFTGSPAAPVITKDVEDFRAQFVEAAKEPPNFAGHYRIMKFGCGSSCILFAIVNLKTGKIYVGDFSIAYGSNLKQEKLRNDEPLQFKTDSRLLVVVGSRNEKGEGVYFYEWTGDKLKQVRSTMKRKQK